MKIDWAALGVVAVVSIVATVLFVLLLSLGVRFLSATQVAPSRTAASSSGGAAAGSGAARGLGFAFLGLAGLLVLFCLWLIVPQFH